VNLKDIRDQIDALDSAIIQLLSDRMEKAILTKKMKKDILDAGREQEVLTKISANVKGLADPDFCVRLYKEIMTEAKRLQAIEHVTVGFLGEHGSNSDLAARSWDPSAVPIPCQEFQDILDNVESGLFDFGILPVENTLGGVVGPANSLLIYTDLHIISAIDMPIPYCLMAAPGADYREIRKVYSHPQSLLQCRDFIARAKLEPIAHQDTASAAKMIAAQKPADAAAIANKLCAELYGLTVIKEDVQGEFSNRTRFFILSREENKSGGAKCSIVFTTLNKAGALFRTLEVFAKAGINLTRIESVPSAPGDFAIFVDLVGSNTDPKVQAALEEVRKQTADFRMLGCYDEKVV
jgi:prephenate dehydratase/chorismate mutase